MHQTAIFYADKAASISSTPQHFIIQARLFFSLAQYRRALHVLESNDLPSQHQTARLLAAQCHFELRDYDACLSLLGDEQAVDSAISTLTLRGAPRELHAALCVLRARVYERLENPECALLWYKRAFRCDIFCVEAFEALSNARLLPPSEAANFVNESLSDTPSTPQAHALARKWLSSYYTACANHDVETPSSPSMNDNIDLKIVHAKRKFSSLKFGSCLEDCRQILRSDPHAHKILPIYLATLVELNERNELFLTAHNLVDNAPKSAISWLAVGYHYLVSGKPELARRFFQKCTALDMRVAPAWIAIGHAFGTQDESDQAMAAYRTVTRLFPGSQEPLLFMGMEYVRQGSLNQAATMLRRAAEACPRDPAPVHELGVVLYRMGDHAGAAAYFKEALGLWESGDASKDVSRRSGKRAEAEEATLVNLGHCYRRQKDYNAAKRCYERALALRPRSAGTCSALGMTLHAMWDLEGAVAMYHRALRNNPEDANCSELLERALYDMFLVRPSRGEDLMPSSGMAPL
ncbi:Anaphase-promoting complex cyclosome subunit 3 [Gracilaria domingensis]|nr:Anaphase-promoting complex cyclosome subunit 3 [Gracilaria domingensis]